MSVVEREEIDFDLIGKRIREVRKSKGISQMKLAEKADLSISYISMLENAKRKASLGVLIRIANSLEITVDELLNGNQLFNPTEYQTDIDLLMADCDHYEKRIIYEVIRALKEALRSNRTLK